MTHFKSKDRAAELVNSHLEFASRLAKQFYWERSRSGIELEDIEGSAFLGLCDAARRFDEHRGNSFRTYAYFRIRGAMFDSLRHGNGISRTYFNELSKYQAATTDEQIDNERTLPYAFARSVSELGSLVEILKQAGIEFHLNAEGMFSGLSYAEDLDPEQAVQLHRSYQYLRKLVSQLPERERKVIELRYFAEENYDRIRAKFNNVSKSWVSRVHGHAIDLMRDMIKRDGSNSDAMCSQ